MAITVTSHGNIYLNPNNHFRVQCDNCDCIFEFTGEDVKLNSNNTAQIKCPDCGKVILQPKFEQFTPPEE